MSTIRNINRSAILKVLGVLLIIEGLFLILSLAFSAYYDPAFYKHMVLYDVSHDFLPLLLSGGIALTIGLFLFRRHKKLDQNSIGKREGYIIVTLSWVTISLFGALPYLLSGATANYADAFFETMSGFSTTGASIFTDIEILPKGLLFWRALTQWIGGMGIIVLSLAVLPVLGIGGMQLFDAEVPGVAPDKLHPRIASTAKNLWGIYVVLTLVLTGLLMTGGLNLFDSLCHSFTTMSTGGFGTKNDSAAGFTPYLQYLLIIFMFIAGINFSLHFFALKGRFQKILDNEELRDYTYLVITAAIVIGLSLFLIMDQPAEKAFRDALFQVVSIITTTGFVSSDYLMWPSHSWLILFLLMFTGGCAGSTGGGIKMVRIILLFKNSKLELKRLIHPQALIPVRFNRKAISQNIIFNVLAFFLLYIVIFAIGSLLMSMMGLNFETSIGAVASSLGNIGPAIGSVGPVHNYAHIPIPGKWLLAFLMLLGRLELFTVLILFSRAFWNK